MNGPGGVTARKGIGEGQGRNTKHAKWKMLLTLSDWICFQKVPTECVDIIGRQFWQEDLAETRRSRVRKVGASFIRLLLLFNTEFHGVSDFVLILYTRTWIISEMVHFQLWVISLVIRKYMYHSFSRMTPCWSTGPIEWTNGVDWKRCQYGVAAYRPLYSSCEFEIKQRLQNIYTRVFISDSKLVNCTTQNREVCGGLKGF